MFHEGRHVEKNKRCSEKKTCFFVEFSSIFRGNPMNNREKITKNGGVHKDWQKSMFGTAFFCIKSIFERFLGFLWVPGGLPGRPGSLPESFIFSLIFSCAWKLAQTVPGEAPGRPRGSLQAPPGYYFKSIFGSILYVEKHWKHVKNMKKPRKNVERTKKEPWLWLGRPRNSWNTSLAIEITTTQTSGSIAVIIIFILIQTSLSTRNRKATSCQPGMGIRATENKSIDR